MLSITRALPGGQVDEKGVSALGLFPSRCNLPDVPEFSPSSAARNSSTWPPSAEETVHSLVRLRIAQRTEQGLPAQEWHTCQTLDDCLQRPARETAEPSISGAGAALCINLGILTATVSSPSSCLKNK